MTSGGSGRTVTVRSGESIYTLSQRYGVPTPTIIQLNGLTPPYELSPGQRIVLPAAGAKEHVVGTGDTLYSVSRRYGIDVQTLASANGLVAPYRIREGQVLTIPHGAAASATVAEASARAPTPATPASTTPSPSPNAAAKPAPGTAETRASARDAAPADRASETKETKTASLEAAGPLPSPPPLSGKGFAWPVTGKLISTFGTKEKGNKNDGINIAAARGTPVRASQSGVVAYAGNELRGFGNLVLIRHADGWITAYAHNDKLLVKRGDTVSKGQEIAEVGSSGGVDQPQLHFQLRKGKEAVDPRRYLPQGAT